MFGSFGRTTSSRTIVQGRPARLRTHRALTEQLAVELRRSGANVDLERAIPALYKCADNGTVTEAILDVVYSFPRGPVTRHLDVTVRCPFASAYKKAHANLAVAVQGGEDAKAWRYGPSVIPVAFESFGRLGRDSTSKLEDMAAEARQRPRFRNRRPTRTYARWRHVLERTLVFETAVIVLLSLGSAVGHLCRGRQHP